MATDAGSTMTVTGVASANALPSNVAVTVISVTPASSRTVDGSTDRVKAVLGVSSSAILMSVCAEPPEAAACTPKYRLPSASALSRGVRVSSVRPSVSPAAMTTEPPSVAV